jgi:hypothetical protein
MGEPTPPRNRDLDIPTKSGEELGQHEPLSPGREPEQRRYAPLPEEETYEDDGERRRPPDEKSAVED